MANRKKNEEWLTAKISNSCKTELTLTEDIRKDN